MTTKLEIIGPYTEDHEGPFCTRDGKSVELRVRDGRGVYPLVGYIGNNESMDGWLVCGGYEDSQADEDPYDLMNAREVPVAREFWVNEYKSDLGLVQWYTHQYLTAALAFGEGVPTYIRTIHVREVLEGEGA